MNTGFEVHSMLTVPLKTNIVLGAIQLLNKEVQAGTNGQFDQKDLALLQEVAEYSATLMHRMLEPKFQLSAEDTAKFVAKFSDLPLVTKIEDLEIDEKLVEVTGDAIIRREGIFPLRKTGKATVAVIMANPLDYAKREAFQHAIELTIDDVRVAPATLIDQLLKKYFKEPAKGAVAGESEVDIAGVAELIGSAFSLEGGEVKAEELESEDSAPIIQLANRIIEDAYICGASDIHVEPLEKEL